MSAPSPSGCPTLAQLEAFLTDPPSDERLAAHLERCPSCREQLDLVRENNALLAKLARSEAGRTRDPVIDADATGRSLGQKIGGYEIIGEIHRGGQGIVYEAVQMATKRTVALKVLLAGAFATSRQRLRFEREIDLVAGLKHPNVVTVYDSGVTDDGRHWLAMEHIEGEPLDHFVRGRRLSLREVLGLFARVCAAVSYAHQRGIIHRDLKPGNVIVDGAGEPHVLDFGLAKPIDPEIAAGRATVTVAGDFMGTIAYASPEQTLGGPDLVDVRSDVYTLGVILYEMLTGHTPYPVTGRMSDVLGAIAGAAPTPLRAHPDAPQRVDNELETIGLKALAKEPSRRYQTAEALRRDVEHYLVGEPIDAKRDSGWYVFTKTLRRHKVRAAAAAAFVVLLAGFAIAMSVLYQRARTEADKVTKINIFLEDTLGSVEPGPGGGAVSVRELLDEGVHWIELALGDQPEIEAAVRTIIGNGYRNLGLYEDAEHQLVGGLETRRRLFGDEHLQVAKSLSSLALLRGDQGRYGEARRMFEEALGIRRKLLGGEHLEVAMVLANLAEVVHAGGDSQAAEALVSDALAIRRKHLGPRHGDVAMCQYNLARYLEAGGALAEARRLHERALAIRHEVLHEEHPDLARSLIATGRLLLRMEEPAAAEPRLRKCLELRRRALGPGHWRTAEAQCRLGECLGAVGRYKEAEAHLVAGHEGLQRALGDEDDLTQTAVGGLINLYDAWGREGAAAAWRKRRAGSETPAGVP
ncbi:MAG: serine/threonine-protein kinase [Planctomycetota bacterium]